MRLRLSLVFVLAAGAASPLGCSGAMHVEPRKAPPPPDPCAAERSLVRSSIEKGKLRRASARLEVANRRCPESAFESWADELDVMVDLGDDERARALVTRVEAAASAPEAARRAAKKATATLLERARARAAPGAREKAKVLHAEGLALVDKGDRASFEEALLRFVAAAEAFAPNGQALVAAGLTARNLDRPALAQRLMDRATRELEVEAKGPVRFVVTPVIKDSLGMDDVAWSPSGDRIAASDGDDVVVLSARTYREVQRLTHPDRVTAFVFSPDGKTLAASALHSVYLWDLTTGERVQARPNLHTVAITALAISPDGTEIASSAYDGKLALLDATTLAEKRALDSPLPISSLAYSPDGKKILAGIPSGLFRRGKGAIVWDRATGKPEKPLAGHSEDVVSVAFSPDGKRAVTASWDETARVWDVETGKTVAVLRGHESRVERAAFSPDGRTVATSSWDETTRLWDAATGKETHLLKGFPHPGNTWPFLGHGLAFSPDGRWLASALGTTLRVWDARAAKPHRSAGRRMDEAGFLDFSPGATELSVIAPSGKEARTWTLGPGASLKTEGAALDARPPSDRFAKPVESDDGKWVARAAVPACVDLSKQGDDASVVRLCTVPKADAGLVLAESRFEYMGTDPCAARELLACEAGTSGVMLPIEVCEEHFLVKGLLAARLAGREIDEEAEATSARDCPTSPY